MSDDSRTYRTKSGRVLTDADIEALADEAERLTKECERYGLPVGLDGLLRHIYGNHSLSYEAMRFAADGWEERATKAEAALAGAAREHALREALDNVQWLWDEARGNDFCPECDEAASGHLDSCHIGVALDSSKPAGIFLSVEDAETVRQAFTAALWPENPGLAQQVRAALSVVQTNV